jgi:HEAT repeat protein
VDLLTDSDWWYRQIALQALSAHALAKSAAPQILACLSDPSPWVVRNACRTIGHLQLVEAHDRVRELVTCADANVRELAVFALSSVWQTTDFRLVLDLFRTDHSRPVREEAAKCLAANVSEDNWRRLVEIWLHDALPRHRLWACQCIARFGDAADRQWLLPLVADPDGHVRKAAKRAYDAMPP